jgi:hypothetical protein
MLLHIAAKIHYHKPGKRLLQTTLPKEPESVKYTNKSIIAKTSFGTHLLFAELVSSTVNAWPFFKSQCIP